jgi:modification methylase
VDKSGGRTAWAKSRQSARRTRAAQPVELPLGRILPGDCIEAMRSLPAASVDLVFADPPYNLQLGGDLNRPDGSHVDAVTDHWDRFDSFAAYDRFTREWLTEARRVLKPDGAIWVIGSYHNIFRVGALMQDLGFWILNDVGLAQVEPDAELPRHALHQRARDADLGEHGREGALPLQLPRDEDAQRRAADAQRLGDPLCGGQERLKQGGHKVHPTQKPEALLYRVLLATTETGDVVLDPFFGTGTTGAVAKRLGRQWIGCEREGGYREAALERIELALPLDESALETMQSRSQTAKVAFGALVEAGYLAPGAELFDKQRRWSATVRADGSILSGRESGSIHGVGKALQGAPSCNGWTFWHVEHDGHVKPIDTLRQLYLLAIED